MVIINWFLEVCLKSVDATFQPETFVDDWQVQFRSATKLDLLWSSLQEFASMVDLEIDLGNWVRLTLGAWKPLLVHSFAKAHSRSSLVRNHWGPITIFVNGSE